MTFGCCAPRWTLCDYIGDTVLGPEFYDLVEEEDGSIVPRLKTDHVFEVANRLWGPNRWSHEIEKVGTRDLPSKSGVYTIEATYRCTVRAAGNHHTEDATCNMTGKEYGVVSRKVATAQQCKNLRINGTILDSLQRISPYNINQVVAMDWLGYVGYMFTLLDVDGVYYAQQVGVLVLPQSIEDMDSFTGTLNILFSFKRFVISLGQKTVAARNKRQAIDVLREIIDVTAASSLNPAMTSFLHPLTDGKERQEWQLERASSHDYHGYDHSLF